MRIVLAASAAALVVSSAPLAAPQTAIGSLEGTIKGTIASRPVSAAQVSLVRLESEESNTYSARADARGRFRVDSLPAGHYLVQVSHPTFDSLDVALPADRLIISDGRTTHSDFSLPSGGGLRGIVCPGVTFGPDKAVVAGHIVDADRNAPIAGAKILVEWTDITVDRKARTIATQRRMTVVSTGRLGEYRLCGVPAELALSMQVQHAGRAGATTQLSVSAAEGVVVRDLSLSLRSAPTIAALDSLERVAAAHPADAGAAAAGLVQVAAHPAGAPAPGELALSGSAIIDGRVSSTSGEPVVDAQVWVRDAPRKVTTDAAGRFVLRDLPSGTQVLVIRRFGYALAEIPVELRPDVQTSEDVHLRRAVNLDSVRVIASKWTLEEFENNRKTNVQGRFLTLSDIRQSHAKTTSDLLPLLGGPTMIGRGRRVKLQETSYDPPGSHGCKGANVVINGVEGQAVDDVLPNQIAGIEFYDNAASAPLQYAGHADCGLIVIWLRAGPRWHGWRAFFTGTQKDD